MGDQPIKVTDKRMFTAEGELREEYRSLEEASPAAAGSPGVSESPAPAPGVAAEPPSPSVERPSPPPASPATSAGPPLEIPDLGPALGAPTFFDLVAVLAEPVSIYLGDVDLGDGRNAENLEMARLHIDLLATLREKTVGNLSPQEAAFLEDLIYRLRLRYVQKRG